FMAMQIQKLATQHQSMTQDQINRRVSVAANLWMEHKDTALSKKHGFSNSLIFKANGQKKMNDKAIDNDPSIKSQTLFREMTGMKTDITSDLCKIIESTQSKLGEKIQSIFKEQQALSQQQEQTRQLQREQHKQFDR
ncbi:MAG: hypothetical protein K0M45_08705, partial [Candidatus Paracaedibacteraceae bacterium]|nr:hypothetical protein [Candidatus Paracaedibacteraceae bacterium]